MSIESRLDRIEKLCGMDGADEPAVEIPVGASTLRMTDRQVTNLLRWVQERNRGFGGPCREQSIEASGENRSTAGPEVRQEGENLSANHRGAERATADGPDGEN